MKARITVTLKTGVLDPQGKAIEGALASLGIDGVASVRQGKLFDVEIDGGARAAVEASLRQACERLLANTVIETYHVDLDTGPETAPLPSGDGELPNPSSAVAAKPVPPPLPGPSGPVPEAPPASTTLAHDDHPDPAVATEEAAAKAAMPTEGHP